MGPSRAEGEPVPSYLIERRDDDEHAAPRGPEPVLSLALSLVEDAAGTWDGDQDLLRIHCTSDLLPRCGVLLGIVLRKPEEHSPSVRERLLALVARLCEAGRPEWLFSAVMEESKNERRTGSRIGRLQREGQMR